MKKTFINIILPVLFLGLLFSCEKDQKYDIDWPVPTVTEVSTLSSELSSTITLKGNFTEVKNVKFGNVDGVNLTIAADAQSLTVDVPRTMDPYGAAITVINRYKQSFTTEEVFVPVIPETTVSKVSEVQVGLSFTIEGVNVDLLTEIKVNGEPVSVLSATPTFALISVAGLNLQAGQFVDVSFKSLSNNDVPTVSKVNVIYPFILYNEVVIWDFEDDAHSYVGEGTVTIETGDVLGKQEKYFSLRGPGYAWNKATGEMAVSEVPDVSSLVNPHLTFCVRTPVGSAGYFQMEDQAGNWRHFGYGFRTEGEWMVISEPVDANWEGGEFNIGAFMPKLGFKAGNADDKQDIDIAFIKITEGKFDGSQEIGDIIGGSTKEPKIVVMDFEDAANWPDIMNGDNTIGSLNFRSGDVSAFYGDHFYSFIGDGTIADNSWGAYWGQTLSKSMKDVDLTTFNDPYLSFALNSNDAQQYIIVRMYQYDEQLVLIQKFFPQTSGAWQTFQFSLFGTDMENWSDASTDLGAHYKSLKRFNPDEPIDRIEVIVCKNSANPIVVSLDEMVITEGARY